MEILCALWYNRKMIKLPDYFRSILWSYDFEKCDPEKMQNTIIKQAIHYGDIDHLKWIRFFYGSDVVMSVITALPKTELPEKSFNLASLIFSPSK
jgi:hypothetical protein